MKKSSSPPDLGRLNDLRASEAAALFQAGQAGRTAMQAGLGLFLSVATIAIAAAVATHSPNPALPIPAFLGLFAAYVFRQYIDVTVLGMARLRLENLVNEHLGARALIYESVVASIPKSTSLAQATLGPQILIGACAAGVIAGGEAIAIRSHDFTIVLAYSVVTALAFGSASVSYLQMRKSPTIADEQLENEMGHDRCGLWLARSTYDQAMRARRNNETPNQVIERLLQEASIDEGR